MIAPGACLARYRTIAECLGLTREHDWLHGDEARELARINDPPRRRQWLAGRLLIRELLGDALGLPSTAHLQILSRDARGLGTSPRVLVDGDELDGRLSIAHSPRGVLVAVTGRRSVAVGADLCQCVPVAAGFLRLWFSPAEQGWIASDAARTALVWAAKEALFKAIGHGAAWNPRDVEVLPGDANGLACRYRGQDVAPLTLDVRTLDGHAAAIAVLADDARVCLQTVDGRFDPTQHEHEPFTLVGSCSHD